MVTDYVKQKVEHNERQIEAMREGLTALMIKTNDLQGKVDQITNVLGEYKCSFREIKAEIHALAPAKKEKSAMGEKVWIAIISSVSTLLMTSLSTCEKVAHKVLEVLSN